MSIVTAAPNFTTGVLEFSSVGGQQNTVPMAGMSAYGRQKLPTDAIGSTTVTFDGVNANSEIRVFSQAGVEVAGVEDCAENQILSWSIYPANNTVTIRIVNWLYDIKELTFTPTVGNVTLPIQQKRDKWSLNPA